MPMKGDDVSALNAANVIEHLSNVDFDFSEPDYAVYHPSSATIKDLRGLYEEKFVLGADGMIIGQQPHLTCLASDVPNYGTNARLSIDQKLKVYKVRSYDDSIPHLVDFTLEHIRDE